MNKINNVSEGSAFDKCNALHYAAYFGHAGVVRTLLSCDADMNAKNEHGETALQIAIYCDRKEIIELLKSAGAKSNNETEAKN